MTAEDIMRAEGFGRGTFSTSTAALVDHEDNLTQRAPASIGLMVAHLTPMILAEAASVDDPLSLQGQALARSHVSPVSLDVRHTAWANIDDADALIASAPAPAPTRAAAAPVELPAVPASVAKDWADVAERPIPRPERTVPAEVPQNREMLAAPPPPPPPAVEPQRAYAPAAAPPATATPAPWAAFAGGAPPAPAAAVPLPHVPAPAPVPTGSSTPSVVMKLDQTELRALIERLSNKGALTSEDIEASKKK
jgi:hypothetical protein